jgi:hypothetical protein
MTAEILLADDPSQAIRPLGHIVFVSARRDEELELAGVAQRGAPTSSPSR